MDKRQSGASSPCNNGNYQLGPFPNPPPPLDIGGPIDPAPRLVENLTGLAVLGVPNTQRGTTVENMLDGPLVGKLATSPLPPWWSPTRNADSKIENGYLAHQWAKWLHQPYGLGDSQCSIRGEKSEMVTMWARWLYHPCRLGGAHCSEQTRKSKMATRPTCRQSGYVTLAVSGGPQRSPWEKMRNGDRTPMPSEGRKSEGTGPRRGPI